MVGWILHEDGLKPSNDSSQCEMWLYIVVLPEMFLILDQNNLNTLGLCPHRNYT